MTSDQLAAIEARLRAATPGPWTNDMREVWTANGTHCICDAYVDEIESGECSDATFIANAPADIAALIAEVERLNGIYASAVNGRAEMRTALMEERKKRPLGITEWSTVENVERVIAERDAARFCARDIRAQLEAVMMSRDAAIEAFREHGRHGVGCSAEHGAHYRCRCGFDDAREALKGAG